MCGHAGWKGLPLCIALLAGVTPLGGWHLRCLGNPSSIGSQFFQMFFPRSEAVLDCLVCQFFGNVLDGLCRDI